MSPQLHEFLSIDLMPMLSGVFAALTCAVLGNFLVVRKLSLMGDAISHAVLPGIAIAFLLTAARSPLPMFIGATLSGVATVLLVELVKRFGRVESGAAMGVVFSILFALGVLLISHAARNIDLDADCVLYGNLENIAWWAAPDDPAAYTSLGTYVGTWDESSAAYVGGVPRQAPTLAIAALLSIVFVVLFFKELRIAAFDPGLSTSLGINAGGMHFALMVFVAIATVASFEAVGSILVVAMLICPAATARMLTDRLSVQIVLSSIIAVTCGVLGYVLGAFGPMWFGLEHSVNTAGMMTVVAGVLLGAACLFSPSHGVVAIACRRVLLSVRVARENLLAALYRLNEQGSDAIIATGSVSKTMSEPTQNGDARAGGIVARLAVMSASMRREVKRTAGGIRITPAGLQAARDIIRSHRLWETYLVGEAGLREDHVHDSASHLEHVLSAAERARVQPRGVGLLSDPHNRPIPPASETEAPDEERH